MPLHDPTRRNFLKTAGMGGAAGMAFAGTASAGNRPEGPSRDPGFFSYFGVTGKLDDAPALKAAGVQFLTENTRRFLKPDQPDSAFDESLDKMHSAGLRVLGCNSFIRPKHLRCVGADATHGQVLDWAHTCFERLHRAGGRYIVFGSSGSRRLKDGWPKARADEQFVALLSAMGPLAAQYGVTVALEQLREQECNYLNTLRETAAIIRAVNHPNVRQLADFFHMAHMGDTPEDLASAADLLVMVEIAEKEGRTAPGVQGQDFSPFFQVLRDYWFSGPIAVEGRWEPDDLPKAFATIRSQC